MARQDTTMIWPGTATIQPRHDTASPRARHSPAGAAWVLYRDTGFVSRQGGSARVSWFSPSCVMIQFWYRDRRLAWLLGVSQDRLRHSAQQRYDTAEHAPRYGVGGARYGRKGCDTLTPCVQHSAATWHASALMRAATRTGIGVTRSRRGQRYFPARATCAQPRPWVGALCTQLSFNSVHCFESLFGTRFMNTVHEVFKK